MEFSLLDSILFPNMGLSGVNLNLVGLQCGYWTPNTK